MLAKEDLVLAGLDVSGAVFHYLDPDIQFLPLAKDGDRIHAGTEIAKLSGNTRVLLAVNACAEPAAAYVRHRHLDRALCRAAQRPQHAGPGYAKDAARPEASGKVPPCAWAGQNHRFGLYDGVLIKDNHIAASGGITQAVEAARKKAHHLLKIEVETRTLTTCVKRWQQRPHYHARQHADRYDGRGSEADQS